MSIHRFTISYSSIVPAGSSCVSPDITPTSPTCITIPCDTDDSFDIEINTDDDCGQHCISFVVDCSSECSSCGQTIVTKCFCVDSDDCGGCETCDNYLCVSSCAEGKVCDDDTCVDCTTDSDCLCNSICVQGSCKCEGGLKKRADGCCVECFDGEDLGNCRVCINGTIVATDCPNGHCNPNTGDCQECYNNTHCTEPNECCNSNGICECCPGFILDPITGQCVEQPPCFNAQDCIDIFGKCYWCTADGCQPINCPEGQICDPDTGECVPECGNCPDGYGCINGMCKPCNELSCTGTGLQCEFAQGCHCVGTACEWIDCDPENVELAWSVTQGTPGQVVQGTGLPALQGSISISPTGLVHEQSPNGSTYMNHEFSLALSNATSGTFTLYNTPTQSIVLGSGTSVIFDVAQTGPNLVGFVVKFVETGTGRTATWGIYRTPTAPLTASDVWNSEFTSTGTPAQTTGGTPGGVKLCSNNLNFIPTGVTNVSTTGTLVVTFIPDGLGCLNAYIQGCGTWNGDVVAQCGGTTITIPAPELHIDEATCCDITDPNCDGWGTGDPCADLTIQNITLVALPTYGSTGSGDGEFLIVADWTTAGLSFLDLFYLDPSDGCWSTANNPNATSNDVQIVTSGGQSPLGPSVSNLSVVATLGDGGCIRLGYTCELKISGCKKLQGEVCLTECQAFTVDILDLGSNTYKAMPSLNDEPVTYTWVYPGLLNTTGQTVTITPTGGTTTLIVTAKYGSPVKCTATDSLVLSTTVPGCTNPLACNYNSTANVDDSTCVVVGSPSYDCTLGGFQPGLTSVISEGSPAITWWINGSQVLPNQSIAPGTYTVGVFFNGVQKCTKTLVVPQCYRCNSSDVCVPAPTTDNNGMFTTSDCDGGCDCAIEINVTQNCSSNRSALVITAQGGSGTYTVSATDVLSGAQVLAPIAMTSASSVTTPLLCDGTYRILVDGGTCTQSIDYTATCYVCSGATAALTNRSYDCDTNQLFFTIVNDPCVDWYNVKLLDSLLVVKANQTYTTTGAKTIPVGVYPGDGVYTLRLGTSEGCTTDYVLVLDCNGTAEGCAILGWDTSDPDVSLSIVDDGTNLSFTVGFVLDPGAGTYTVELYATTGGSPSTCVGSTLAGLIDSTSVVGALGSNIVNFPDAVATPAIATCYAAKVTRNSNTACTVTVFESVDPSSGAPPQCDVEVTNLSYDTDTGNVLVSWTGSETSNDITVEIRVSATPCSVSDPIVVSIDGNGANGTDQPFGPVHQQQGVAQCATVTVYDTNEPTCTHSLTIEIPACSCEIEIVDDQTFVDDANETIEVTYRTTCTSGDITIDVSGDATGSGADAAASTTGVAVETTKVISLTGYPSTAGSVVVELIDDADAGCSDSQTVAIPGNCEGCGLVVSFGLRTSGTLNEVVDIDSNTILSGSYSTVTDAADIETDVETGVVNFGGDFCTSGDRVDVGQAAIDETGMIVTQNSDQFVDLNYAEVDSIVYGSPIKVYFGDCGCNTGRTNDYTATVAVSADDTFFRINFANNNASSGYTSIYEWAITTPQTFTTTDLANIELELQEFIADICSYTIGSVSASYNSGSDQLTITLNNTNAGVGMIYTVDTPGPGENNFAEFTQS